MKASSYDCYIGIDYGTSTCKLSYVITPYGKREPAVVSFRFSQKGVQGNGYECA